MDPDRGFCPPSTNGREFGPDSKTNSGHKFVTICFRFAFLCFGYFLCLILPFGSCADHGDAEHITAILGESVVLNCPVSQPETPYIIQWKRQHHKIPIYIWYDGYDPHVEENYKGRASRVNPNANFGLASLNLTSVKELDQGWYECNVFYLDRSGATDNGTWIHLDVHAPPRFVTTPDDVTYVNIGDSIILNCEAEGTPTPEIMWFRDDKPVMPSDSVGIFNDGTELRINKIRDEDIGDYLCVARNAEGRVVHDAKVVIAGGAVIVNPPHNLTRLEGEKADFPCEAKALPGNVTVVWKRENVPIDQLSWLDTRSIVRKDGTLVINPTSADDGGFFTCEVSNGIGTPQRATAYLNVEYPARVTYTPTVQYLPFRQQGIIKCHIKSNPPNQFVTWIKDKRLFDPDTEDGVVRLQNGSLLITKVNQGHQGRYSCTPYNRHTTAGSSGDMEVLVREPPIFDPRPQGQYHGELGEDVTLVCGGKGSPIPTVTWRRRDGQNLPRDRTEILGGNLTIRSLRKTDHGFYECEVKNEIMDIVAPTQLLVEGTTPHPPYNISTTTTPFGVKLSWLPGYPGGRDYDQKYTIWYRTHGSSTWSQIDVKPEGSTTVSIHNLSPQSTYEFQVQGKNDLGDGMFSDIVTATTKAHGEGTPKPKDSKIPPPKPSNNMKEAATPNPHNTPPEYDYDLNILPTDSTGDPYFPLVINPKGPKPDPPTNLNVKRVKDGFLITWDAPENSPIEVQYYDIEYKISSGWKKLNKEKIVEETSYKVKKLISDTTYTFRVLSKTVTSYDSSQEYTYQVPVITKEKEITAAIVGGILFFIVAIILSVCMVKICNNRKRKKQDKAYNMVACRVGDNRNGGQPTSPVPLKNLLRGRISGVNRMWSRICFLLTGEQFLDTTDSRPLHTSYESQRSAAPLPQLGEDVSEDQSFYGAPCDPSGRPLASISRTLDGRFVLDKDSEDGGFTSPRKPIRSLVKRKVSIPYYSRRPRPLIPWMTMGRDAQRSQFLTLPSKVEGGVYDVRAGTTHSIIQQERLPPQLTLPTYDPAAYPRDLRHIWGVQYPYEAVRSPEFGRHVIPDQKDGTVTPYTKQRRVRSSSPRSYADEWRQLAHLVSFSDDVSSVRQPSSVERSFPSTVLSSFQNSAQKTPSTHGTPLNAASLLQENALHIDYDRFYREQQMLRRRDLQQLSAMFHSQNRTPPRSAVARRGYAPPHSAPQPFIHRATGRLYYPQHLSPWVTPRRPSSPRTRYRSPSSHIFHPPYREPFIYVRRPRSALHHYVNVPPPGGALYQRIPGRGPYYLLKPSTPSETPKPLATSSPPRTRVRTPENIQARRLHGDERLPPDQHRHATIEDADKELDFVVSVEDTALISAQQQQQQQRPAAYTRDQLQRAIGRVRSGGLHVNGRPHSAPDLSYSGRIDHYLNDTDDTLYIKVKKGKEGGVAAPVDDPFTEKSEEVSHEQSPNSSSGFGSKNTSQQQSSSQSGQSASALGLDASRFEASESTIKLPSSSTGGGGVTFPYPQQIPSHPPSYDQWLSRQVLPQFRIPVDRSDLEGRSSSLLMGVPGAVRAPSRLYDRSPERPLVAPSPVYQNVVDPEFNRFLELRSRSGMPTDGSSLTPLTITTSRLEEEGQVKPLHPYQQPPFQSVPLTQPPTLDISVDDHYEFDTLLSPTPGMGDDSSLWGRSRTFSGERGLSDSEIYGSGGRRKEAHESMEARVAAMKQEFHEYRQRQAKRRSSRELESVC